MVDKKERKERLDLSISADVKQRARKLAKDSKRSVSGLFEFLIDEEWENRRKVEGYTLSKSKTMKDSSHSRL